MLLARALAALASCSLASAWITFSSPNQPTLPTLEFPTVDYFQYAGEPFAKKDCFLIQLIPPHQADRPMCRFEPFAFPDKLGDEAKKSCTVMMVGWSQAYAAGCRNIAEATVGASLSFLPTLPLSLRADVVLVIALPASVPSELGGPVTTPYLSHSLSVPDRAPALNVVLMTTANAQQYLDTYGTDKNVNVSVTSESGPWNDFFLAGAFVAVTWILLVANLAVVAVATWLIYALVREERIRRIDLPVTIYGFSLVSAVLFALTLFFPHLTLLNFMFGTMSAYAFHIAFYLFLLFWCKIALKVSNDAKFAFELLVYASMMLATAYFIVSMFWILVWPGEALRDWHNFFRYFFPSTQAFLGGIAYVLHWHGSGPMVVATLHRQAYVKTSLLVLYGFIALFVRTLTFLLLSATTVATSVGGVATLLLLMDVACIVRVALLCSIFHDDIAGFVYTRGGKIGSKHAWQQLLPQEEIELLHRSGMAAEEHDRVVAVAGKSD